MIRATILGLVGVAGLAAPAFAGLPIQDHSRDNLAAAYADRVVVGRIRSPHPESELVKAKPVPDVAHDVTYQVFRLAVTETLAGGKAVTEVRIGGAKPDGKAPVGPEPSTFPDPLQGGEGLFFLRLHHSGEFYTIDIFIPKYDDKSFAGELKATRRYLGLLADPLASLHGKEPTDRLATAVLLLVRYRASQGTRSVPIPAEENKLILAALAGADWEAAADSPLDPWQFVYEIWRVSGSKPGEVFKEPALPKGTAAEQRAFLRDWVRQNRDAYRIERRVAE
jgi:hypothetical protein